MNGSGRLDRFSFVWLVSTFAGALFLLLRRRQLTGAVAVQVTHLNHSVVVLWPDLGGQRHRRQVFPVAELLLEALDRVEITRL